MDSSLDTNDQVSIGGIVIGAITSVCVIICVLKSICRNRRKHKGRPCLRLRTIWRILFTGDLDDHLAELDVPETKGVGELHGVGSKQEMPGKDAFPELEAGRKTSLELDGRERASELA